MSTLVKNIQIKIDPQWCKGCGICTDICPKGLIQMSCDLNHMGFHYAIMNDPDKCNGCGMCAQMCPDLAIEIWKGMGDN